MVTVSVIIIVLAGLSLLAQLIITLLYISTPPVLAISFILAAFTLTAVLLFVWVIGRWVPKPRLLLLGVLFWGGGIATAGSILTGLLRPVLFPGLENLPVIDYVSGIEAPVVEEIWKGIGLIVVLIVARKFFQGPMDGIVYGCLIGAGFAFTENILYFAQAGAAEGVSILIFQFILRGIALPLLHPICVSLTGLAAGLGARRGGAAPYLGFLAGLIPAMVIHAIWNNGTMIAGATAGGSNAQALGGTALLFVFVMIPIFIGWILLIVLLRRRDIRMLRGRLGEYAAAGWFSPADLEMLTTMRGRVSARRWASRFGPEAKRCMDELISCATSLALTRERIRRGWEVARAQRAERALLAELPAVRHRLLAAQSGGATMVAMPQRPPIPGPGAHGPYAPAIPQTPIPQTPGAYGAGVPGGHAQQHGPGVYGPQQYGSGPSGAGVYRPGQPYGPQHHAPGPSRFSGLPSPDPRGFS